MSTNLECNSSRRISLFETNIRIVGGLLGAYELSQDVMFLDKARECVDLMLPIFETSPTGRRPCCCIQPLLKGISLGFCCMVFAVLILLDN